MNLQLSNLQKIPDSNRTRCKRARLARDSRFDGDYFTAVKTTGIYCRPMCLTSPPLEKNVDYFRSAVAAAQAGFRPCLRCRPESAPRSYAGDAGINNALKGFNGDLEIENTKPWRSYLTMQLWNQLN